jgi:hypothetical protein
VSSINELSDSIKNRYLDKAGKEFEFIQKQYRRGFGDPDKQLLKLKNRYKGYKKALSKLSESRTLKEIVNKFAARQAAAKAAIAAQHQSIEMGKANIAMAKANVKTQAAVAKKIDRQSKVYHKDQKIMKEAELNEISKATLERYKKKADNQADSLHSDSPLHMPSSYHDKKLNKRMKGSTLAFKKINNLGVKVKATNESIKEEDMSNELNEISKKTLGNYIKANHMNNTDTEYWAGYDAGTNHNRPYASDDKDVVRKRKNRERGINRAVKRLTKEDVSILDNVLDQDPVSFKDHFDAIMTAKVSDIVDEYKQDLAQSMFNPTVEEGIKHGVFLKGGSIGNKSDPSKPVKIHDTKEDAHAHAKRMNKILSPGEKKYYGLKYTVRQIEEGNKPMERYHNMPKRAFKNWYRKLVDPVQQAEYEGGDHVYTPNKKNPYPKGKRHDAYERGKNYDHLGDWHGRNESFSIGDVP